MKTFTFHQKKALNLEMYVALMEQALKRKPNSLLFLQNVFNSKLMLGAFEEAEIYYKKILTHKETTSETLYVIAKLFYQAFKTKEALICLNKIETKGSLGPDILLLKAKCLNRLNESQQVYEINSQLIVQFPEHEDVLLLLARTAYRNQDFSIAIEKCNLILENKPNSVEAHTILINAQYNINQVPKIEPLINYKELVKTYTLANQVSSIVNFNNEINDALNQKKHWISQAPRYSTIKGEQLKDLLSYKDEIFKQLTDLFSSNILDYLASIKALNLDYFSDPPDDTLTYSMWSVRLNSGGHQAAHTHPSGWISGVYYTSLPQLNKTLNEGALEFGVDYPKNKFKSLYTVQPEEGTLILFPSYLSHRTVPFESDKQRICISFDVFPYKQEA